MERKFINASYFKVVLVGRSIFSVVSGPISK